tara:strand:+ start:5332 stop:7611 length:2280 start_codon:yes stop_codon:yes gene_type:complete
MAGGPLQTSYGCAKIKKQLYFFKNQERSNMGGESTSKVNALLNPKSVAILGARENPMGWTARIFANYKRFKFCGPVWPVNPRFEEIWGVKCYSNLSDLPEIPDHLVVMRAAASVTEILREAADLGTRSATVYASGFSELGTDKGRELEEELRLVIKETDLAVCGPNCLGSLSAKGKSLSLPDDRIRELVPGPVAMVGQSGTTTPGIGRTLIDRGIDVGYIVTSGNEVGLTTADYINYFVEDPEVKLVFCLIEAVRNSQQFLSACRRARDAGKPVVALKMGVSAGGRAAALAHTGSMAGSIEAFDAVAGNAGVIRVESGDAAIDLIELLVHAGVPEKDNVGVLVYSGGVRGLSLDAADRYGVPLPEYSFQATSKFKEILGDDLRVTNPLDAPGFMNQKLETIMDMVTAIQNDSNIGMILFQEDLPPSEGINDANKRRTQRVLDTMIGFQKNFLSKGGKPIGLISPTSSDLTTFSREERKKFPNIPVLNEPDRAFRALRSAFNYRDTIRDSNKNPNLIKHKNNKIILESLKNASNNEPFALNEIKSKEIISSYGLQIPIEKFANTTNEAENIANEIGFPLVVKGVSASMTHKSDAGAVILNIEDTIGVKRACETIALNVEKFDPALKLEGWLIAQAIPKGLELVLGIQNDAEMGPVIMFGLGGVWLEIIKDVSFCSPGMSRECAQKLIYDTSAGQMIDGYRGNDPYDREAIIDAIVAVGRLAADNSDTIESVDINPFVAMPVGEGAFALDALVVLNAKKMD